MIARDEYYETIDLPVYREVVAPLLTNRMLDIHAHARTEVAPRQHSMKNKYPGRTVEPFLVDELQATLALLFPDQECEALVFGMPFPEEYESSNRHVAQECARRKGLYPLYVPEMRASEEQIRATIAEGRFYGFKPYWRMVDWKTTEDEVSIQDMLPEPYMKVAGDLGLLIMLHMPGSGRLAAPANIEAIRSLSRDYPRARIIIAHLGRSYCPWSISSGIGELRDLPNVYWDTSFVQEAQVYQILFDHVDPARVMYGTDLPLARTRGRRVCINDRWVDVTRDQLGWTATRDPDRPIQATFMAYEMIRALKDGALAAGLPLDQIKPIFYDNGKRLLDEVGRSLGLAG